MPIRPVVPLILSCALSALSLHPAAHADELRHRAFAGIGFRSLSASEADSLHLKDGLMITLVMPNGAAEKGGLRVGDVIQRVDEQPVADESGLRGILRQRYAGDEITMGVVRGGEEKTLRFVANAAPEERADSVLTEYTSFTSQGVRLRAVVTSPPGSEGQRLPAVLLASALGSPQLIGGSFRSSTRTLAHRVARSGFRVLRFELREQAIPKGRTTTPRISRPRWRTTWRRSTTSTDVPT